MASKKRRGISRYLKYDSERSGFTGRKITFVRDQGVLVAPDEVDTPPPSNQPLGGSDISGEVRANSTFTAANANLIPNPKAVVYVQADQSIRWNTEPWVQVVGSNNAVTMTANPQLVAGAQDQELSLLCIGSGITLIDGNGLALTADRRFVMNSGSIINFMYSATDNLWHELSRGQQYTSLGEM